MRRRKYIVHFVVGFLLTLGSLVPSSSLLAHHRESPQSETPIATRTESENSATEEKDILATATVGMKAKVKDIVLPGPRLESIPVEGREFPFILRIEQTYAHGSEWRYDFEFYGLEPGEYNLVDYLQPEDGTAAIELPSIQVQVTPVLSASAFQPNEIQHGKLPDFLPYRWILAGLAFAWLIGLGILMFWKRRSMEEREGQGNVKQTLAERLRISIDRAVSGAATHGELADLERCLIVYWRKRLGLEEAPAAETMQKLLADPQAGGLLRQLERWLHSPQREAPHDIESLLSPYRDVDANAIALPRATTTES